MKIPNLAAISTKNVNPWVIFIRPPQPVVFCRRAQFQNNLFPTVNWY